LRIVGGGSPELALLLSEENAAGLRQALDGMPGRIGDS